MHRRTQGQHAGDQEDRTPVDGAICLLHVEAAGQDHNRSADHRRDRNRSKVEHDRHNDAKHDGAGKRCPSGIGRLFAERCQYQEVGVRLEQLQAIARPQEQQRVTDLQSFIGQFRAHRFALTPDAREFDAVALAKVEFTDGAPSKRAARVQRGVHQGKALGFESRDVGRHLGVDLEILQAAKDVKVAVLALEQQQVTAQQNLVAPWHDGQFAVPEDRKQSKVEDFGEATLGQCFTDESAVFRQANDEHPLVRLVFLGQPLLGKDVN